MKYEYENDNKLNSVEVTLQIGCILNCRYCPQKALISTYFKQDVNRTRQMSMDTFRRVLSQVKRGGTIVFSGMCEGFLNPECAKMIRLAYDEGYRINLLTTLMGFHEEYFSILEGVKFDAITLHIPDEENNAKFEITEEYLSNLKQFQKMFPISGYSCHGTIHSQVKDLIDGNCMLLSEKTINNRAGNIEEGAAVKPKGKLTCLVGFAGNYGNWTPEVLPDGTLVLCCMDYGMKHVLGNLNSQTAGEILHGEEYLKFIQGMQDENIHILCRNCVAAKSEEDLPSTHFANAIEQYKNNPLCITDKHQAEVLEKFAQAENICIFGLGKLFWDNYYHQGYDKAMGATIFSDNDSCLWGKEIRGVLCVSPSKLLDYKKLLVVIHVSNDQEIREQLKEIGIINVINILEIYKTIG